MSPARPSPSSRRNSSGEFKPYTRGVSPIIVSPNPVHVDDGKWVNHGERVGFPTYAQYKMVEATYLSSLTPRRQGKALISQALFDRIWDVLHQPESQGETAQFRFWARKMFVISKTHRITIGVPDDADSIPQEVLLHDNLLVAIQEQLYDLLCYCHGSTGHGGRDKTCALIRKHYTWVPKDLVSNFIKSCPTCIMKKCGNLENPHMVSQVPDTKVLDDTALPGVRDFFQNMYCAPVVPLEPSSGNGIPWPSAGGPKDLSLTPSLYEQDSLEAEYREAVRRVSDIKSIAGLGGPPTSFPMSREVSLYKGLPNGWHLRHADYAAAHAEFMRTRHLPISEGPTDSKIQRPRVPSILPLWGPERFAHPDMHGLEDDATASENLSALQMNLQAEVDQSAYGQAEAMQYSMMPPIRKEQDAQDYMHQIDPILLDYSQAQLAASSNNQDTLNCKEVFGNGLMSSTPRPSSTSIKRAAAPLHLNLEFPSEKTFQALFAYRESLDDGTQTPDSPLMGWHPGNPSPTSSESSRNSSKLSTFPMNSAITTPANSALPTPIDEYGSEMTNDIKGKKRMMHVEFADEDEELNGGIRAVCGIRSE